MPTASLNDDSTEMCEKHMANNEPLPTNIRIALKTLVFASLLTAAGLVTLATFSDLYNPGSTDAQSIGDNAETWMFICVCFSVPLWIEKMVVFKKWADRFTILPTMGQKRSALWVASKPILKQVGIIFALFIICNIWLAISNPIPPDVADNYVTYYSQHYLQGS